jgi:hypothetical protein
VRELGLVRSAVALAAAAFFILAASTSPSALPAPTVQCDYGDASSCSGAVRLALALADDQGQSVASAQVVSPNEPPAFANGDARGVYGRSGATAAAVVLRDATGSIISIVVIGTGGVSGAPGAWIADPSMYPAW